MDMGSPCISPQQRSRGQRSELEAQPVLCYCHSYVQSRQVRRFVSQLLINSHMLRNPTVVAPCLTPTLQSSWALLFFCSGFMRFLKLDLAFSPQKLKKPLHFCHSGFFLWFLPRAAGKDTAHAKQ